MAEYGHVEESSSLSNTTNKEPGAMIVANANEYKKNDVFKYVSFRKKYPTFGRQMFCTLCCIIGSLGCGITYSFTGTLLPSLQKYGYIDEEAGSWLAGVNQLACPIGIVTCSLLMPKFGRKACLIYSNVPWILGWILLTTAGTFWIFIVGCILVGSANASLGSAIIVYTSEIAEPKLRGFFNSIVNSFFVVGVFVGHFLEIVFPWRLALGLSATSPILCLLLAIFVPESPNWLVIRGRLKEAETNFFWLRGASKDSDKEFADVLKQRENNVERKRRGILKNLSSKAFFVPFGIMALMFFILVFTGGDLFAYYAVDTLKGMSPTINAEKTIVANDISRVAATLATCFLIKKLRRRTLYFASIGGTLISMIMLVAIMHFKMADFILSATICIYSAFINIGILPIPWIMIAEIFPQIVREVGSGLAHVYFYIITFLLVKMIVYGMGILGMELLFVVFFAIVFSGSIILYFVMPETEECTLQEVEDKIGKKNHSNLI